MSRLRAAVFFLQTMAIPVFSQSKTEPVRAMTPLERRATISLESLRNSPPELRNMLLKMPKGSDLHNHLYGALYAETWIRDAAEDQMCLYPAAIRGTGAVYSQPQGQPCGEGKVPADQAFRDPNL